MKKRLSCLEPLTCGALGSTRFITRPCPIRLTHLTIASPAISHDLDFGILTDLARLPTVMR